MDTETLIIGGGLAGLAVARALQAQGRPYQLVEARPRLGGRIFTRSATLGERTATFDLGPAWFWPGQTRIERLILELGLTVFEQYATGTLIYEDERGRVHRGQGHASMQGSLRMRGGLSALIETMARSIPAGCIRLGHRVISIATITNGMMTRIENAAGRQQTDVRSRCVVLALPPRLAAATIDLDEAVSREGQELMAEIPTWMAGHAKIVAVYERAFWREAGSSGDAMSRRGPLMEIHDASPQEGGPSALFGFVGVPATARTDACLLRQACQQQLGRLFGPRAAQPIEFFLKDWAQDDLTAAPGDRAPLSHHPQYGLPAALSFLCEGRLMLGSTETAAQFGGYLEGALEAADRCVGEILRSCGVAP